MPVMIAQLNVAIHRAESVRTTVVGVVETRLELEKAATNAQPYLSF